jgi:hypothetical protein
MRTAAWSVLRPRLSSHICRARSWCSLRCCCCWLVQLWRNRKLDQHAGDVGGPHRRPARLSAVRGSRWTAHTRPVSVLLQRRRSDEMHEHAAGDLQGLGVRRRCSCWPWDGWTAHALLLKLARHSALLDTDGGGGAASHVLPCRAFLPHRD